jgi:hypothetical protein
VARFGPRKTETAWAGLEAAAILFLQRKGMAVYTAAIASYPDRVPRRDERDILSVGGKRMSRADMIDQARSLGFKQ